jgi:two-component system response regulator HupR/HoxA
MVSTRNPSILLVDDERRSLDAMRMALEEEFEIFTALSGEAALNILAEEWIQVVFCDQRMAGMKGVELLTLMRERWPETLRVIVTGYTDTDDIISAINDAGTYQFLTKPWLPDQLLVTARNATRLFALQRAHDHLSLELRQLPGTASARLADGTDMRGGPADRDLRCSRADPWRDRHGQGTAGPRDPLRIAAVGSAVPCRPLRRDP